MDRFSLRLNLLASLLITASVLSVAASSVAAEKMDVETHTLLIEKLEGVVSHGKATDVANVEVRLRLADLLAERARLHVLAAEGKDSVTARADRRRAIQHYQAVVNQTLPERRAAALLQMAHLHQTLNEQRQSVAIYTRIAAEGTRVYPRESVGLALSNWGDILYRRGEFKNALSKFEDSLKLSERDRRGYIMYRIAWCQLNLGRQEIATQRLVDILRTPELLIRKSSDGSDVDSSFHEDAARDLVSFLARGEVTPGKVRLLMELSPEKIRRDNLRQLANETERLGKKRDAIYVWALILEDDPSDLERIEGRVHLAVLAWGLNRKGEAVEQLNMAADAWRKIGCDENEECEALKARMRKLVVDWNRLEKERVTNQLAQAYAAYNNLFDNEYDMHFWAAQVSRILKRYNEASALYRKSSILAHKDLKKKEDGETRKMFEAALVAQIEMAESGGNLDVKETAYDHYLDLNPKGPRALEVRYQRARVYYDKNRHDKAANEFRAVALSEGKEDGGIRKKAADLSLDALVLAKQEKKIEPWALGYAARFPQARTEYLNIARRAVLKEVAAISADPKSSESELKYATRRMREVNLEGTTKEERNLIFRNHLVLAVRTRDLDETDRAADRLIALKGVSDQDREFALEKKVWAAEMRLEFGRAYQLSQKMEMGKVREDDRELRLAYLAELAGRSASKHYQAVLSSSRSRTKAELAAVRMIRSSRAPWNEFKRQDQILRHNRDVYANMVLELYARTRNTGKAQEYLRQPSVRHHEAGQTIARSLTFKEINAFDRKISGHRLLSASDRLLQQTLTKRLVLLKEADRRAQETIRSRDWTLQAITLSIVARENERLYNDVLRLPVPYKLKKPEQKKQYEQALAAQAAPYKAKADEVNAKLNEFWKNDAEINAMAANIEKSVGDVTRVLAEEARELSTRAPGSVRSRLENAIAKAGQRPSNDEIVSARRALARDPFSERQAERLKSMEAALGRDAMVTYLDARLSQLRGGVK